jgi:hypothetical protein
MKKTMAYVAIAIIMLAGCDPFLFDTQGYEHLAMPLEAAWPITAGYEYQDDFDNYWKSPMEFERDGGGDCEDFATHLLYLLGEGEMLSVHLASAPEAKHALVWYDGKMLEPQLVGHVYAESMWVVDRVIPWDDVMRWSSDLGRKSWQ